MVNTRPDFDSLPLGGRLTDTGTHWLPVRVYYEDTDFSGVVYHARYLHFFERGRTETLRAMGIHHSELASREPGVAFAVRRMDIEFVRAARVDDCLITETCFQSSKGARLLANQVLWRSDTVVASAVVEAVCMNTAGRAIRPPKDLVERWQRYI